MKQWQFRYKRKTSITTALVEARTLEVAEELARVWCQEQMCLFLGPVVDPVVAREVVGDGMAKPHDPVLEAKSPIPPKSSSGRVYC